MRKLLKTTKGKAVLGAGVTGIAATTIAAILLLGSKEAYRTISVEEVNGTSIVQNERHECNEAYKGMHLMNGDDVNVQSASDMTLLLDMDKYVYAEENTHFRLQADGDSEQSKTRIYLEEGSELNRLSTKLTEGESYEVETPNSVMAVRGTVFRASVSYDKAGIAWTNVDVYEGFVEISLKTLEGEFNGVTEIFEAGEAALIRASADFSEFVVDENDNIRHEIDYKKIPQNTALQLSGYIEDGQTLCIGKDLLLDYTELEEHKMEEIIVQEATCEQEGKMELRCSVCHEVEKIVKIPKKSHETSEEWETVQEPDCETDGLEQKVCSVCGEVIATRTKEALGHKPGIFKVTMPPTCIQEGQRERSCTVCGKVLATEMIPMTGHRSSAWQILTPDSCDVAGQRIKTCTICGITLETSSGTALGHNYGGFSVVEEAGCTTQGSRSRSCSRCGKKETSLTAALGHGWGSWKTTKDADCTNAGKQKRTCSRCGKAETKTINALGHNYGEWSVAKEAGCTTNGSKIRSCSRCEAKETSSIAALGHDWGSWKTTEAPDCITTGKQVRTCNRCSTEETNTIPALGHVYGSAEHDLDQIYEFLGIAMESSSDTTGSVTATLYCTRTGCQYSKTEEHTISYDATKRTLHCETCNQDIVYEW